jgi:hypothetical protein
LLQNFKKFTVLTLVFFNNFYFLASDVDVTGKQEQGRQTALPLIGKPWQYTEL